MNHGWTGLPKKTRFGRLRERVCAVARWIYSAHLTSFILPCWMTRPNFDSSTAGLLTFKTRKSRQAPFKTSPSRWQSLIPRVPADSGKEDFIGVASTGWNELTKEVLFVSGITDWILKPTTIFQPLEYGH